MTDGCGVCTINVVEDAFSPSPDNPSKPGGCWLSIATLKLKKKNSMVLDFYYNLSVLTCFHNCGWKN
jgi:hypothetical protein